TATSGRSAGSSRRHPGPGPGRAEHRRHRAEGLRTSSPPPADRPRAARAVALATDEVDHMNVKAEITNCVTGKKVVCIFTPKEYTFSKQNKWEEKKADKKHVAHLKFSGGAPANLKMQLLFDTYEAHEESNSTAGDDVRKYTKELWEMMKIDEKKKEPPHCRF